MKLYLATGPSNHHLNELREIDKSYSFQIQVDKHRAEDNITGDFTQLEVSIINEITKIGEIIEYNDVA